MAKTRSPKFTDAEIGFHYTVTRCFSLLAYVGGVLGPAGHVHFCFDNDATIRILDVYVMGWGRRRGLSSMMLGRLAADYPKVRRFTTQNLTADGGRQFGLPYGFRFDKITGEFVCKAKR